MSQNTKQWEESSTGWVNTMTKSKEHKELYQEYIKTIDTPVPYRDWLNEKENGTTTSSTKKT